MRAQSDIQTVIPYLSKFLSMSPTKLNLRESNTIYYLKFRIYPKKSPSNMKFIPSKTYPSSHQSKVNSSRFSPFMLSLEFSFNVILASQVFFS